MAEDKTIAEYAEAARVTGETARQQLKDLFARTGTRRQAELVRLVMSSLASRHIESLGADDEKH